MVPVTGLAMAINTTFSSILNEIQLSNLNFSIQMTPFAAYITLKKSVQRDLNGDCAVPSPPLLSLLQRAQQETLNLQNENNQLRSNIAVLEEKYENVVSENDDLVAKIKESNKNIKALTDTTNTLQCKISEAERKDAKNRIENVGLESKMKAVKNKYVEELNDLKVRARDLEKGNKMKEKDIHNLSKSLDSARSTIKALKYEKSQLKTSKTKLETEITKLKRVETTKKKVVPNAKQNAKDVNENNNLNPGAPSEMFEPLFMPSMVSHWNPQVMKVYQRPASISSMITHCTLLPPPSRSFLSMKEVLHYEILALDKIIDRMFPSFK